MKVLGLSGSLRVNSYNTAALRAARAFAPEGMEVDIYPLHDLPLYNEDLRGNGGFPETVYRFREKAREADAFLFSTPEYNYSVSPALKNALDWGSRNPDSPWSGKPAAIMGATTGQFGTSRAQSHLRLICVYLDLHVINKPEVFINNARSKFGVDSELLDEGTRTIIAALLSALYDQSISV